MLDTRVWFLCQCTSMAGCLLAESSPNLSDLDCCRAAWSWAIWVCCGGTEKAAVASKDRLE